MDGFVLTVFANLTCDAIKLAAAVHSSGTSNLPLGNTCNNNCVHAYSFC